MALKSFDGKRIQNINFIMNDIHASSNAIYEHLVDRDYSSLTTEINKLKKKLQQVQDSIEDEL